MRKSKGTPFKLRSASPFRNEEEGTSEDLGKKVNDKNHLVNVSKNTKPGGRLPTYQEAWDQNLEGINEKYGGDFNAYKVDMSGIVPGDERDVEREAARDEAAKPKVSYEEKDIPTPGKPGDKMDPFTSAEYRVQTRLGKNARNQDIKAQRKKKRNLTDSDFDAINAQREKDGLEPYKNKRAWFKQQKSNIVSEHADAQKESTRNRYDQLYQGRNASRSGEQIDYRKNMSKGSKGTDFTVADEGDVETYGKTSDLEGYNSGSGDFNFKAIGKRVEEMVGRGVGYGRKSGTPFKLNKYKK